MAAYLTPELAPEAIGLYVLGPTASTAGARPNPAKLTGIKSDSVAVIKPNGHRKEETVSLTSLRLWVKGNHTIGPNAAKRAARVNALAELQNDAKDNELTRHLTREEVMAHLSNGVNPLALMRMSMSDRIYRYVVVQIVAIRDGGMFMVKFYGTKHPPQAFQLEKLAVPLHVDLHDLEFQLITRVFGLLGSLPGLDGDVLREVQTEPKPEPPAKPVAKVEAPKEIPPKSDRMPPAAPVALPAPAPAPMALAPGEPPAAEPAKLRGKGEWIIVNVTKHSFRAGNVNTHWSKHVDDAKIYTDARGTGSGAARLANGGTDQIEVMSVERARWFSKLWYQPRRLPAAVPAAPVAAPTPPPAEVAEVKVEVVDKTPAPIVAPMREPVGDVVQALRRAILERGEAEALCLEARGAEARARAAYEAGQVR